MFTVSFDLTPAQVQGLLRPTAKGWLTRLLQPLTDKTMAALWPRLAGPTTVELSAGGLRISKPGGVQQLGWDQVGSVNERRYAWVFQHRPNGLSFVPAVAVAPDDRAAFTAQLRQWAGARYRVREGGLVEPTVVG
ncbi:YcxB family protein [Kitasatospora sp. NPDC058965]|uniref:YcxB family protein n=1 Tax=Kitasatospora sp. NPDC058965 TaxID=3346682 RepID=UPI0036B473F7